MKKYLAMICATLLCVCCLGLAACGGGSSSSAASSGSASAASSSAAAQADFTGDWKIAAIESQGLTMTGDLSALMGDGTFGLILNADGTGSLAYGTDSGDLTWTQKDANTITITPKNADSSSSSASTASTTFDVTYEDGALCMDAQDDTFQGKIIFTKDGTYAGAKEISTASAKPITSADVLTGTWNFTGLNMMGVNMYGDADSLAAMAGGSDTTMTFNSDGTVTLSGQTIPYTVDSNGAVISQSGVSLPVMQMGDDIIIDMSSALGMEMIMMFSK